MYFESQCTEKKFKLFEKMFNMSSVVLVNIFKTLSPFIDIPVHKCLPRFVPLSPQSKFQLVNVLKLSAEVHTRWCRLRG